MTTEEIIDEAVRRLVDAADPERVILFGSYARGDATKDSDLDFLVILKEVPDPHREMTHLRNVLRGLPVPIDVLVYSTKTVEDWGNVKGTVLYPALREGIVLYAAA